MARLAVAGFVMAMQAACLLTVLLLGPALARLFGNTFVGAPTKPSSTG
jgi:uncharacterized membrane protein AbrB (regulator of aidB expression)